MKYIDSPYLLSCEEIYDHENTIWMFLEYMQGGELTKILTIVEDLKIHLSEGFCKYTLYNVAKGLADMHEKFVLHRDIKSDNILFRKDGTIKIADLGFSVVLTDKVAYRKTKLGTMCWMSPEIAKGESYGSEVDVWAFGCFAFELTYGEPPFYDLVNDSKAFLEAINTRNVDRIPEQYSDSFNDFV